MNETYFRLLNFHDNEVVKETNPDGYYQILENSLLMNSDENKVIFEIKPG